MGAAAVGAGVALYAWVAPMIVIMRAQRRSEATIVAALGRVAASQAAVQAAGSIDLDSDGIGEYGSLSDLLGWRSPSGGAESRAAAVRAALKPNGWMWDRLRNLRFGSFNVVVYLPSVEGRAMAADAHPHGFPDPLERIDVDVAETTWCAYAWPSEDAKFAAHAYVVSSSGVVLRTEDYYSRDDAPRPGAAFVSGGLDAITGEQSPGDRAQDGNVWERVK